MRVLRDVLPEIEVTVSSQYYPLLGEALTKGKLDLAIMRAEPGMPDLTYQVVAEEPLVAVLRGQSRDGDVFDRVDARDRLASSLRQKLPARAGRQSAACRRPAEDRPGHAEAGLFSGS